MRRAAALLLTCLPTSAVSCAQTGFVKPASLGVRQRPYPTRARSLSWAAVSGRPRRRPKLPRRLASSHAGRAPIKHLACVGALRTPAPT